MVVKRKISVSLSDKILILLERERKQLETEHQKEWPKERIALSAALEMVLRERYGINRSYQWEKEEEARQRRKRFY